MDVRRKGLTQRDVENLQPLEAVYVHADNLCPNLYIRVHPTGRKSWIWRGRILGAVKVFTLGRFPTHSLGDAREWAREITRGRDAGINVVEQRIQAAAEEREAEIKTCDWGFERYMANEGESARSAKEKWRIYKREISPKIGKRLLSSITHADLTRLLQEKLSESASVSNHMQALIKRWFKWSVSLAPHMTGLSVDPAANLVKLAKQRRRERFLDDYEIGLLMNALNGIDSKFADPIRLIIFTGARRGEAFGIEWRELDNIRLDGTWIIPGARTKNGVEHILPLPNIVIEMLLRTPRTYGQKLVWPGGGEEGRPMSGFSKAIRMVREKMQSLAARDGRLIDHWTLHDLRRSMASGMASLHHGDHITIYSTDLVDRVLNHVQSGLQRTYIRHSFFHEKKVILAHWSEYVMSLQKRYSSSIEDNRRVDNYHRKSQIDQPFPVMPRGHLPLDYPKDQPAVT